MSTRARAVQRRCAAALALASLAAIASPQRASPSDDPPAAQAAPAQEPVASTGYAQSPVQLVHNAPAAWAADGTPVLADHHHGLPWGWALFVLLAAALGGLRLRREWNRRAVLQARAEAAEKGLRELADGVPGAVWRSQRAPDGQSRYLYVSNRIHDLTGYTAEETHSRGPLHSFVVIHPEDRAGVLAAYDRMIASPGREDLSYRLLHKDGQYRWVQSSVSCSHESGGGMLFAGVLLDARRTRQLEAERDHALRLLRDIADGIPGSIWQFRQEPDGRMHYSFMSEGIRHITGRSPEETNALMQAKSFVSVHPDDQGLLRGLMQRLVEKGGLEEEIYRLSTKDGGWKWVRSAAAARREPDGTIVSNGITLDATRIREAEDALSLARAHLQDLIDSIPGAVWRIRRSKDGVFRFEFISEGIGAITGGTLEPNGDALRVFQKNVPDADFQRLRLALTESALSGQTVQVEFNSRHANGHELRLMARANIRIDDGDPVWTGVLIDLTERRQLERQLAAARSRYEEIATAFPGAIWQMRRAVNGEESFTYMSANIERLTGRPAAATLHRPSLPFEVMHPDDRERVRGVLYSAADHDGTMEVDYRLRTAEGGYRWVHVTATARHEGGEVLWNGVVTDAAEGKRLEAELQAARATAEEASRAKSRLLANMSHEIRTPLNAIIGLSHLALDAERDDAQRDRLNKINRGGKWLLRLLNDLLDFSRLEAHKLTITPVPFVLTELLDGLVTLAAPAAAEKGLEFAVELAPELPPMFLGDSQRIQQVLVNLLANAAKFTDEGRIALRIDPCHSGNGLCFTVSDTGIGMSAEELSRVFNAFEQADTAIARRHGGSGLGLSICQELVRLMRGEIHAESAPGGGSRFVVNLPLPTASPQQLALPPPAAAALAQAIAQLAAALRNRETAARAAAVRLRRLLALHNRGWELDGLERQLGSYDFESAEVELMRLSARWGVAI